MKMDIRQCNAAVLGIFLTRKMSLEGVMYRDIGYLEGLPVASPATISVRLGVMTLPYRI